MSRTQQDETTAQPEPTVTANALRTTRGELASGSTQAKKKYGPDSPYTSVVKTFEEAQSYLGREMSGCWFGAMPIDVFLDKYIPATVEPLPDLLDDPFWEVPRRGSRKHPL